MPCQLVGCALWLRADIAVTKDGSNKISVWGDGSGRGNAASQSNPTWQPTWVAAGWPNGQPAVQFTGATPTWFTTPSISLGSQTLILAMKMSGTAGYILAHNTSDPNNESWLYGTSRGPSCMVGRGGVYAQKDKGAGWAVDNTPRIVSMVFGGTASSLAMYINGVAQTLTDTSTGDPGGSVSSGPIAIGANIVGGGPSTGLIAEVAVFSRSLPAIERQRVERYMGARYGISVA